MEKCQELILDDIVAIDFYRSSNVTFSVPFNAPAITQVSCVFSSTATLKLRLEDSSASGVVMQPAPKAKVEEKREVAGLIRTHTIEAVVTEGFATVQTAIDSLANDDIVAVLTNYEGARYVVHPFPNTGVLTLTDERQQSHTQTVRYSAQSFSGLVKIISSSSSSSSD